MSACLRWGVSCLSLLGASSLGFAANTGIGLVLADGSFQLDHARVWGNATLFEGSAIETNVSSSQIHLSNGVRVGLAAGSRARIYASRLVLEKGIGQLDSANYYIEADGLRVMPDKTGATARVQLEGPNRVVVAAREGPVVVNNSGGVLVARLDGGREMSFEPQDPASAATKVSGILAVRNGKFILVDRVTNVTLQLQGDGLAAQVGNLVEITGTVESAAPVVPGASQLIHVIAITALVKGAAVAAGAAAGGAAAGGAAAGGAAAGAAAGGAAAGTAAGVAAAGAVAGGLSTGAMVAVVGGVAAAGTVGGLGASNALPGQGQSKPTTSR